MLPVSLTLMTGYLSALFYPFHPWWFLALCLTALGLWLVGFQGNKCLVFVGPFGYSAAGHADNHRALLLVSVCLFGLAYMQGTLQQRMASRVWMHPAESSAVFEGVVTSVPLQTDYGWVSEFATERHHYSLFWPQDAQIRLGERWRVQCRLRPISPVWSPGAFDPAKQAFLKGIDGQCSVKTADFIQYQPSWLVRAQAWVRHWVDAQPFEPDTEAYAIALLLGDRSALSAEQRELLRQSHTSHLLVVSGLHLSLVFGLFYLLSGLPARLLQCHRFIPVADVQWTIGIIAATLYAGLCDFPIPTQRALIMLAVPASLHFARRNLQWGSAYLMALVAVLLVDPLALIQFSSWLSFGAVAALMLGLRARPYRGEGQAGRLKAQKFWSKWVAPQWLVAIALAPLLWLMGVPSNPASVLVNLVAIPLVSIALLPVLLLALLTSPVLSSALLGLVIQGLNSGFGWLEWTMQWGAQYQLSALPQRQAIALFGLWVAVYLSPVGLPGRRLVLSVLLACWLILIHWREAPEPGLTLILLDVGQGQAALVGEEGHWLLLDTGPGDAESPGQLGRVVMPFLKRSGIERLDAVVFSHRDKDHTSGMYLAPDWLDSPLWLFGEPEQGNHACRAGQSWRMGPMTLSILSPEHAYRSEGNAASCVVEIRSPQGCVLLPGDIDKRMEYHVLDQLGPSRPEPCNLLVASHHGSSGSTTGAWLDAFAPQLVLVSAGKANRFGHPSTALMQKLAQRGIGWRSTHIDGALKVVQQAGSLSVTPLSKPLFYWQ